MRICTLTVALAGVVSTLSAQTAPGSSPPVTPGSAVNPLAIGRATSGTVARGDTVRYAVRADSAFVMRIALAPTSAKLVARLMGPKGAPVRGVASTAHGSQTLQIITNETGVYQLQLFAVDSTGGAFTVTLQANERLANDPGKLVAQLLAPWDRRDGPGAAVAAWRGGRTLYARAFGMANLAYDIPFAAGTPTNIGSTSKQFTAFAVMLLVEEGKLALDDDVRKHIPELKDFGQTVTVRHLLTHTSGYRELYNSLSLTGRRLDESDWVGREEFVALVQRQPALQNAPGAEFNYNNTAFGLAAMIVARASKMPFEQFMAERVFRPIGMLHTQVRADVRVPVRGATVGYSRAADGTWRDLGDLGGSMGAGGIYTTLADLQTWAEHLLNPRVGSKASVAQMMTPFTLTNGKSTGYGFGLFADTQGPQKRVQHGGADVSHRSMLALYPDLNAGITVQSNDGTFDSSIAFRLAEAFFPELATKPATSAFNAASWDVKKFDEFVGRYAIDANPAFVITFSRAGDSLITQATGQGKLRVLPTSDTSFAVQGVAASVEFVRDSAKKVVAAILVQGGARQRASRVAGNAAPTVPWAPTAAELGRMAGRYFSEELETYWDLFMSNGKLMVRQRRLGQGLLTATTRDTFNGMSSLGPFVIMLERDRAGQVIGFYAGNGRSRDIRFERVR